MRIRSIPILALVLASFYVFCADELVTVYENKHHGFSLPIPTNWSRIDNQEDESEALFLTPTDCVIACAGVALEDGVDLALFEKQAM